MKNLKIVYLLFFFFIINAVVYSQQTPVSSIQRNVHNAAIGLKQELNATLDTLTLKSDTDILRVTLLNHTEKDSEIIDIGSSEVKIPLYHLKKGRYTIAVYTNDKIIALGANRISEIAVPENAITDLEESILRSSLSEKEQIARNIKPLKKKPKIHNVRDTRVASVKIKKEKATRKVTRKRKKKKRPYANQKSAFAIAAEKKEREKSTNSRIITKPKERKAEVVTNTKKDDDEELGTLITVTKVTYNLSQKSSESVQKQSREDYRANNLRPNGKPYQN